MMIILVTRWKKATTLKTNHCSDIVALFKKILKNEQLDNTFWGKGKQNYWRMVITVMLVGCAKFVKEEHRTTVVSVIFISVFTRGTTMTVLKTFIQKKTSGRQKENVK